MSQAAPSSTAGPDRSETGGWFCYGRCRGWTELNMDREQNVCARCGQPTVRRLPPAGGWPRQQAERVPVEQAREHFERMRMLVNQAAEH